MPFPGRPCSSWLEYCCPGALLPVGMGSEWGGGRGRGTQVLSLREGLTCRRVSLERVQGVHPLSEQTAQKVLGSRTGRVHPNVTAGKLYIWAISRQDPAMGALHPVPGTWKLTGFSPAWPGLAKGGAELKRSPLCVAPRVAVAVRARGSHP